MHVNLLYEMTNIYGTQNFELRTVFVCRTGWKFSNVNSFEKRLVLAAYKHVLDANKFAHMQ